MRAFSKLSIRLAALGKLYTGSDLTIFSNRGGLEVEKIRKG